MMFWSSSQGNSTCPCEVGRPCAVYRQLLRGEVEAEQYVTHLKAVVAASMRRSQPSAAVVVPVEKQP